MNADVGNRVWVCRNCGFRYEEAAGLPDEGIAPGTPWEAIPEDWICPWCGSAKSEFDMMLLAA